MIRLNDLKLNSFKIVRDIMDALINDSVEKSMNNLKELLKKSINKIKPLISNYNEQQLNLLLITEKEGKSRKGIEKLVNQNIRKINKINNKKENNKKENNKKENKEILEEDINLFYNNKFNKSDNDKNNNKRERIIIL